MMMKNEEKFYCEFDIKNKCITADILLKLEQILMENIGYLKVFYYPAKPQFKMDECYEYHIGGGKWEINAYGYQGETRTEALCKLLIMFKDNFDIALAVAKLFESKNKE